MKVMKLAGISMSTILALGVFTPLALANDGQLEEKPSYNIEIMDADIDVDKTDLIDRLHQLLPGKFDFLYEDDFQMSNHSGGWGEEDMIRHSLHFQKQDGNQYLNGNVEFVGDDLQLQHFSYHPLDVKDALFPPSVSKDEAREIAEELVNQLGSGNYNLSERNYPYISPGNRSLTEPVEYQFYFQRLENDVPVVNQDINVTVLGNGDVTRYSGPFQSEDVTYEEQINVLEKENVLAKIKENLNIDLQYIVEHNYQNGEADVNLVYVPSPQVTGVHGISGKWEINQTFQNQLPEVQEITMLSNQEVASNGPITRDEVKEMVEQLVTPKEGGELRIESIQERERDGIDVFSVQYMIHYGNSGHGSNIEIMKETGEIFNFHNAEQRNQPAEKKLSYDVALDNAVEAIETYLPSAMHEHAYPLNDLNKNPEHGAYRFSFPQVKGPFSTRKFHFCEYFI